MNKNILKVDNGMLCELIKCWRTLYDRQPLIYANSVTAELINKSNSSIGVDVFIDDKIATGEVVFG